MYSLQERCKANDTGELVHPNGRKDLMGIPALVDQYATMALRRGKKPYGKHKKLMIQLDTQQKNTWAA